MLARILYLILRVLGWKKRTFCQNQGWSSPFFHHLPIPSYSRSLWRLSCDVFEFLLKRRLYLQAQKSSPDSPSQLLRIDPESLPVLKKMREGGLFLAAHYGNYECSGWWLKRLGIPLVASYQPQKPASLEDVVRVRYLLTAREYAEPCFPVLGRWFGEIRPAATMEVLGLLDDAMKIEIEVTAYSPAE